MNANIADFKIQSIEANSILSNLALLRRQFFNNGFVHIKGVVVGDELRTLQRETASVLGMVRKWQPDYERSDAVSNGVYHNEVNRWVQQQSENLPPAVQDTYYYPAENGLSPRAIDFIPAHCRSARALLAHPTVLKIVEALQGPQFILGATPMVVKFPNDGAEMPWHRDGLRPENIEHNRATFTAGIYLDDAVEDTAVRIVPGSHLWSADRAKGESQRRQREQLYDDDGCLVACPKAGDLLIHHTWVLHGSKACRGPLRRVIYESFTPLDIASQLLVDTQLFLAHRRIHLGIMERQYQEYTQDETPYNYNCNLSSFKKYTRRWQELDTWRLHHGAFRRSDP